MAPTSAAADEALKYYNSIIPPYSPGCATDAYKNKSPLAYALSHVPLNTPRAISIICVGAGFSGLSVAKAVDTGDFPNAKLTIYEKNASVGGTWYENRYPGCACDIPVHNYQYSWAPNPYFDSYYAEGPQIERYIEAVADQHGLRKYVKTSHKIVGAVWNEDRQKWRIEVIKTDGRDLVASNRETKEGEQGNSFFEECDIFINASGCFNNWKWPSIKNITSFKGQLIHSAIYPKDANLRGKTVALIGNGSTGVQILPAILNEVEKVYVYIRSRTWITTGFAQKFAGPNGANVFFTDEQKKEWAENPEAYLRYRKDVERELNSRFRLYLKDTVEQQAARDFGVKHMNDKTAAKPDIAKNLIPDFAVGCRRPTPGTGYLEALCSDKVEIVWGEIDSFTESGILSPDGTLREVDTIICATGFNMSFSPRFPVIGQDGINLQDEWDVNPEAYLSVTAARMPNYFIFLGPASPLGHGSVVTSVERITDYIRKLVWKMQTENYSSIVPKPHIPKAYQKHAVAWLEKTAWNSHCVSTFKNGKKDGKLVSLHPGSRLHYFHMLMNPRYEDFDWKSLCPEEDLTFAWMANGFTADEIEGVKDQTWFLQEVAPEDFIRPSNPPKGTETAKLIKVVS